MSGAAIRLALAAVLLALGFAPWAAGAEEAGRVDECSGVRELVRQFRKQPLEVATPLFPHDYIKTGEPGRVVVALSGNGRMVVGARSFVRVEQPAGTKERDQSLPIELLGGTFRLKVPRQHEDQVFTVKTPVAVVAVRGTEFTVAHRGGADGRGRTFVTVFEGKVEVSRLTPEGKESTAAADHAVVGPGAQAAVDVRQAAGLEVRELPPGDLQAVDAFLPLTRRDDGAGGGAAPGGARPEGGEVPSPSPAPPGAEGPPPDPFAILKPRQEDPVARLERFGELSASINSAGVTTLQNIVAPAMAEALRPVKELVEQSVQSVQQGQEVKDLPPGPPPR